MATRPKRPRDPNQLAKLIVDISTNSIEDKPAIKNQESFRAAIGRLGGIKGGKSRAESLSSEQRKEIARSAAKARWKKRPTTT